MINYVLDKSLFANRNKFLYADSEFITQTVNTAIKSTLYSYQSLLKCIFEKTGITHQNQYYAEQNDKIFYFEPF